MRFITICQPNERDVYKLMVTVLFNEVDPKTKEYLAKIGEIVVLLNSLESVVEFIIWKSITRDQVIGRTLTRDLTYISKVRLLKTLLMQKLGENELDSIMPVLNRVTKSAHIRNDVVHSQWFIQYGNKKENIPLTTHKINSKDAFNKGSFDFANSIKDISLKDLAEKCKFISQTISDLSAQIVRIFN